MSNRTREINKITMAIIRISVKLMVYALIILLLYEAVIRGYAFGHAVFFAEAVDAPPGKTVTVQMSGEESVSQAAKKLAGKGLIKSEFAFLFQSRFYDYDTIYPGSYELNTSMTSKEILQILNEDPQDEKGIESRNAGSPHTNGKKEAAETKEDSGGSGAVRAVPEPAAQEAEGADPAAAQEEGTEPAAASPAVQNGEENDLTEGAEPSGAAGSDAGAAGDIPESTEDIYGDLDQEAEGGWIEDLGEEEE